MKKTIQKILAILSRKVIQKYQPIIIAITGSVGKTSAKEAIFAVVSQKYSARKPEKNYNNEIGLPLTIIGAGAPGRNPVKWLGVILKALGQLAVRQKYPQALVLEMGIDRPGDMDHLVSIAKPDIAVITTIGISHYEYFKDEDAIETEKGKLAEAVGQSGTLIVNADNERALKQSSKTKGRILSYGIEHEADIKPNSLRQEFHNCATLFEAKTPSREFPVTLHALGSVHISAALCAITAGEALGIETGLVQKGVQAYAPIPGRLNVISGIKQSLLIDDTYNAAPDSTKAALRLLAQMPSEYKIAALGDMLELGSQSEAAHAEIGELAASLRIQKLVTVGPGGKTIARGAVQAGMDESHVLSFDTSDQAKLTVQNLVKPGSAVLVKGSQGMRMEKISKEIMGQPERAGQLLCRQYGKWLDN